MEHEVKRQANIVVIGIGNRYRGDDCAGIITAEKISELTGDTVMVLVQDGEAARLIQSWNYDDRVILIDTTVSGRDSGTVSRFDALDSPLPAKEFRHSSTHSFSISDAVELARALNMLPRSLVIYGIEGKNFENGTGMSGEVRSGLENAVAAVISEINKWRCSCA